MTLQKKCNINFAALYTTHVIDKVEFIFDDEEFHNAKYVE